MRFLYLAGCYPAYTAQFYAAHPGLVDAPYGEQKAALDHDAFGWADFWSHALAPLGYLAEETRVNVTPLQKAWARAHGMTAAAQADLTAIAVRQVEEFHPDILLFDHTETALLMRIRRAVPSLKLVLGWSGSAQAEADYTGRDLVLSCAQETVERLERRGIRAQHLDHAFDPRILQRLPAQERSMDILFAGQIDRSSGFHGRREEVLLKLLAQGLSLTVLSPSTARRGPLRTLKARSVALLRRLRSHQERTPGAKERRKLAHAISPPVFGLAMFAATRSARVALNIHADSSPRFASNMRLFETTGVGTCLLTDWKENIAGLFAPDTEVVTFQSAEEAYEKARWLLDHPKEREAIAHAGQERCLRDHTFAQRALVLDRIMRNELATRRS